MPVVEYLKDDEHESSGRTIPKGSQHIVTRERAKELEEEDIAVTVGTDTNKAVQDRTRGINNLQRGQKSKRVKKKVEARPKDSSDMTAEEAVSHIKDTKAEALEGFLANDEDRKTVLKAWESKFEE